MITILKTLDLQRKTTAILENAYNIGYNKVSNQIWSASFSLPINDPKVSKVKLLKYVEIKDVGLFRIIPKQTKKSSNSVTFKCEHVLATLLDSVLFKYHQLTNYTTSEVLQYLLDQQKVKHVVLGRVEVTRYFHYSWENENLLSAIFSVPKPFDEQTRWELDTTSYPWVLHLLKPETVATCRIKEGHNLVDFTLEENPMSVYNRIYPLGAGDGVNQLGIESVNNGIPYIEDTESIQDNGIIETIWPDKRFEDAALLKASAEALLKKWKRPLVTWTIGAADVSEITGAPIDELKEGKVIRLQLDNYPDTDLRIMKESKSDTTGDPGNVQLEIGNLNEDLGTTQADLERRQQINELYSVGATNLDSYTFNNNCDTDYPAVIEFPFPDDMRHVNVSKLRIKIDNFVAYQTGNKAGGYYKKASEVQSKSTESGGAYVKSSVVKSESTEGGGAFTKSSQVETSDIFDLGAEDLFTGEPVVVDPEIHWHRIPKHRFQHSHKLVIPGINIQPHTHGFSVTIPAINIPSHYHNFTVTIPAVEIPSHTHEPIYGIWKYDKLPNSVTLKVDGNPVPFDGTENEIDITEYLRKDSNGNVTRDWHRIEASPDDLARINMIVTNRFFIQSHIGSQL